MTNDQIGQILLEMEEMGQLTARLAHDFNNVLTGIYGYSSLALQHTNPNDQIRSYLEQIRTACERATNLTQQLLVLGRNHRLTAEVLQEEVEHERQFH